MSEKTIQSIPIMPFALMLGCIGAVVGLIVGIFYGALFSVIFSSIPVTNPTTGTPFDFSPFALILGIGAVIAGPIAGFIGGLIQGLILAGLYNLLAPRIGGIKLRFKEENQPQQ